MDVRGILVAKLKESGMNGLINEKEGCGCHVDDLMPCFSAQPECKAGFRVEGCSDICGLGCDFHVVKDLPAASGAEVPVEA
jgi:hypothetical protein